MYFSLRRLSRVEDELSEISLIDQILKVSSESPAFNGGMTYPIVEGAVIPGSGSLRVLRERSSRAPDQRLVFDGVEHMVDENPK